MVLLNSPHLWRCTCSTYSHLSPSVYGSFVLCCRWSWRRVLSRWQWESCRQPAKLVGWGPLACRRPDLSRSCSRWVILSNFPSFLSTDGGYLDSVWLHAVVGPPSEQADPHVSAPPVSGIVPPWWDPHRQCPTGHPLHSPWDHCEWPAASHPLLDGAVAGFALTWLSFRLCYM